MLSYIDNNLQHIGDYIKNEIKSIEFFSNKPIGLSTGFKDLDNVISGLKPCDLIVIASRPSMGKTAFSISIALHCALHERVPTVFFSLGESREMLFMKMLSATAQVASRDIRKRSIPNDDKSKINAALNDLSNSLLFIDDTSVLTVSAIHEKCRKLKQEKNLGLVVIDCLQLINHNHNKAEIEQMAIDVKLMCRDLGVPVIVSSQLNNSCDKRDNHRPQLSTDLGDYAILANVADIVIFPYRDEYYNVKSKKQGICELILAKNQHGPTSTIEIRFLCEYVAFEELVYEKFD